MQMLLCPADGGTCNSIMLVLELALYGGAWLLFFLYCPVFCIVRGLRGLSGDGAAVGLIALSLRGVCAARRGSSPSLWGQE